MFELLCSNHTEPLRVPRVLALWPLFLIPGTKRSCHTLRPVGWKGGDYSESASEVIEAEPRSARLLYFGLSNSLQASKALLAWPTYSKEQVFLQTFCLSSRFYLVCFETEFLTLLLIPRSFSSRDKWSRTDQLAVGATVVGWATSFTETPYLLHSPMSKRVSNTFRNWKTKITFWR